MAEYIKREDAILSILSLTIVDGSVARYADAVCYNLRSLPVAEVAEVVRCKDCRYYLTAKVNKKGFLICPASGMEITETDYCSYGARMDKEDEHEAD